MDTVSGRSPDGSGHSATPEPVVSALRASVPNAWLSAPATGLEQAIAEFKRALPGWWFSVGECQVSADASCGPTRESCHIELIQFDQRFNEGFHVDLSQPATLAEALDEVMQTALEAIAQTPSETTHDHR